MAADSGQKGRKGDSGTDGFNEAAADWRRIPESKGCAKRNIGSFNEAAADWRRIRRELRAIEAAYYRASMRPPPIGGGFPMSSDSRPLTSTCFNEAAADWRRILHAPESGVFGNKKLQ